MTLTFAQALISAWAIATTIFTGVLTFRLSRRAGRLKAPPSWDPNTTVLLLRPVDSPTAAELENLAAPLPSNVRTLVISPERPALPPHVRWLPSDPTVLNRKVGHLAAALKATQPDDVVLAVDADVRVTPELIAALVDRVTHGDALVTASPVVDAPGFGGLALEAILNHSPLNFTALDVMALGPRPICGKAIALGPLSREELPRLAGHVGEDLELSLRLHARGATVSLSDVDAPVRPGPVSMSGTLDRMTRWMQVLRAQRPGLFPTMPLLIAPLVPMLVALLFTAAPFSVFTFGYVLFSRTLLAWASRRSWRALAWPLGEAVLFVAWLRASFRRTVVWRGRTLVPQRSPAR